MILPITAAVAASCALLLLGTGVETVVQRLRLKQAFGDGGDRALIRASRSHGNLAEHAPMVIALIALLEMNHASAGMLEIVAALFVIGRVAHVAGLHMVAEPGRAPLPRQIGVISTWAALGGLSAWLLALVLAG